MELEVNNLGWLEQLIHEIKTVEKEKKKKKNSEDKMKRSNGNSKKKNKGNNRSLNRKKSENSVNSRRTKEGKKWNFNAKTLQRRKEGLRCTKTGKQRNNNKCNEIFAFKTITVASVRASIERLPFTKEGSQSKKYSSDKIWKN